MPDVCSIATHHYLVHGLSLAITAEEAILSALKRRLACFASIALAGMADLRFEFCRVGRISDLSLEGYRQVMDLRGGDAVYSDSLKQLIVDLPGRARVICDPSTSHVSILYTAGDQSSGVLAHALFTLPFAELLKRRGLYMLHAAGLSVGGKGLLVAGSSGAGKTTLTIALLRAGFGFMGDDTTFLTTRLNGLRMLAFPDEIDVTANTLGFFPDLRDLAQRSPVNGHQKHALDSSLIPDVRPVMESTPAVLIFPQPSGAFGSVLLPMDKDAALLELMCNVVRTDAASAQLHLDTLSALVQRCRCFRLHTGRDFDRLPDLLRSALNEVLPAVV